VALRVAGVIAVAPLIGRAEAARRLHGNVTFYGDSDRVQVWSPSLTGSVAVDRATFSAQSGVDIISAASVDLVSAASVPLTKGASPRGFDEVRKEANATVDLRIRDGQGLRASYGVSLEPDFRSHSVGLGGSVDLLDRHATLAAGARFATSWIGRARDALFARDRQTWGGDLTWTHLLSRVALGDVAYSLGVVNGFQANPYRWVRLYDGDADAPSTSLAERVPDLRLRHAGTVRLRARLSPAIFGLADYRLYADSWGVLAHTLTLRASRSFWGETLTLGAEVRGYHQGAATFYQRRYRTFPLAPEWRTADKELGRMWTALGGLHADFAPPWRPFDALRFGFGADVLHMRYIDFAPLASRTALILTCDLSWEI